MGVDYAPFRDLLKSGEWEKADDEHRRLMCVLAGEDAEDREWVYFTEVKNMPVTDLKNRRRSLVALLRRKVRVCDSEKVMGGTKEELGEIF